MMPHAATVDRLGDRAGPLASGGGAAERVNLLGRARPRLESFFEALGERPFRARQVLKWIHARARATSSP